MGERVALVTGAAGFIGSHLCERLVRDGWRVRGVDCFTPYYDPALKERNIAGLAREPRFELRRASTCGPPTSGALLDGVDTVWHLAAQAGVRSSWGRSFEEYTSQNINATQRLLEAAVGSRPAAPGLRLLLLGLRRGAGLPDAGGRAAAADLPLRRDQAGGGAPGPALRAGPRRSHGLAALLHRLRPAAASRHGVPPLLPGHPARASELTLFGDGSQTRDFTFIDDVTEANLLAAERGEPGGVYNISGGSRVTVQEVIRMMERITGKAGPGRPAAAAERRSRTTPAGTPPARGSDLGFRPRVDLEEGLGRMAGWMERFLRGEPE